MVTRGFQQKPVDIPKVKCFAKPLLKKKNYNKSRWGFSTEIIISIFSFAMYQETVQINSCRYFCRWYQKLCNTRQHIRKIGFK